MGDSKIEEIHIKDFLDLVEGLEVSDWDRQLAPEPDFWAETNLGLIGIEHTRLFKKVDENGINPVEEEGLANDIMQKAEDIFKSKSNVKAHVSASFYSTMSFYRKLENPPSLKKVSKTTLAQQIASFVLENLPSLGEYKYFENPDPYTGSYFLTPLISSINIGNSKELDSASFFPVSAHVVPSLEFSQLIEKIKKKNKRSKNYKRDYSQIWLVFVASPFNITMDFNYDKGLPEIQSTFDRVFIYRHGDQKYHELQQITG